MDLVRTTYAEVATYVENRGLPGNEEYLGSDRRPRRDRKSREREYNPIKPDDKRGENPPGSHSNNQGPPRKSKKRKSAEWTQKCLDPRCEKTHCVMDCEDITDEDKRRLLKENFDARKKLKAASIQHSPWGDGKWKAMIDDTLDVIALGDYGADVSALLLKVTKIILEAGTAVKLAQFDEPIQLFPAVDLKPGSITASARASFNVTVCHPLGCFACVR